MNNPAPNINHKLWNHDIDPDQGCQFAFTTSTEETTIIVFCQTCGDPPLAEIGLAESDNQPPHVWQELPSNQYAYGSTDPEQAIAEVCIRHLEEVARNKQARRQVRQFLGINQPHGNANNQLPKPSHKALAKAAKRVKADIARWHSCQ